MAERKSYSETLYGYFDRAESFFLFALLAGVASRYLGFSQSITVIIISLGGLAAIFFFMAFRPPAQMSTPGGEKLDFIHLLVSTTLPKLLWISCAVGTSSLMLYHSDAGNEGYKPGLMIHSVVTPISVLIFGLAAAKGVPGLRSLLPIYFRALPLLLAAVYLLRG